MPICRAHVCLPRCPAEGYGAVRTADHGASVVSAERTVGDTASDRLLTDGMSGTVLAYAALAFGVAVIAGVVGATVVGRAGG